ncbi:Rne/Rng family ribonuclease [Leisingera sp. NJS204]|uniref:Rne/Rng family ribonuclease n=1 Tax=Leisingera sp. NJS204 TaxID=2508307 RepID=UPI0010103F1D|nr:ribonuclease E/G [Leisingera sp. NJS204]QAX29889.1 ribonuclease E/G [Leisingera sp. NJS204]
MAKKMLIDATHAEETRVVVVDGNKVEEFDFESENKRQLAGNIYLAKVTRVEPSLQAAFVDYGGNRHGFLAFSEIHPDYYQIPVADREALMEEERAYAEAMRARDEEDDEKPAKPKRSRRSKSAAKAAKTSSDDAVETKEVEASEEKTAEIAGMETIDLSDSAEAGDDLADVPEGSSPVEHVAETPVEEPEDDDASAPEAAEAEVAAGPAETAGEKAPEGAAVEAAAAEEAPAEAADEPAAEANAGTEPAAEAAKDDAETAAPEAASANAGADSADSGDSDEDAGETGRADATSKDDSIESVADEDDSEDIRPPRKPRPRRYKIQEVIKVRQVLLVQVVKEERGNKGAALTTYLSLAGRYCVLMPNTARGGGISRKITNADDRKKLKDIATELDVPTGAGLIVRTAGAKRTKSEIKRDYEYLQRMWEQIRELTLKSIAPAKIYEEGDLIKRSIRDLYSREIDEVLVEGERGYRIAKDFMKMIMPSHAKNVKNYQEGLPLFARFQVESYLAGMFNPTVQLKSGGYIVIGVTEALVAIDVNSGRATKQGSIEETALNTNLEAAEEVARQLRLRDLAGLIVIDFIDMDERKNNAAVEKRMKDKLKTDRARIQVGRISGFGLMEMSRQRLRPGMIEATTAPCPHCHGTGLIRSDDSMALSILRQIEEEGTRRRSREVLVRCPVSIANFLMNQKREHIAQIEARYGLSVRIEGDPHLVSPDFVLEKFKTASRVVPAATAPVVSVDTSIMDQVDAEEATQDEEEAPAAVEEATSTDDDAAQDDKPKRKRRRRRRRKSGNGEQGQDGENGDEASDEPKQQDDAAEPAEAAAEDKGAAAEEVKEKKPSRSRTRTRSRKPKAKPAEAETAEEAPAAVEPAEASVQDAPAAADAEEAPAAETVAQAPSEDAAKGAAAAAAPDAEPAADSAAEAQDGAPAEATVPAEATAPAEVTAAEVEAAPAEPVAAEAEAVPEKEPVEAAPDAAAEAVAEQPAAEEAAQPEQTSSEQEKQPEPAMAVAAADPEPAAPPKPKRRGWWSVGS